MQTERLLVISRDALCLALGIGGITYQQVTGQVSEVLLAVYVGLLGIPAVPAVLSLRRGDDQGQGTTGSSPSSPDPPPPRGSSSASAVSTAGGER